MKNIPAYFDGNTVKTLDAYPFVKNQRLIITILDDTTTKNERGIKSLRGSLAKYANPSLIEKEQSAWQTAAKEKYGIR